MVEFLCLELSKGPKTFNSSVCQKQNATNLLHLAIFKTKFCCIFSLFSNKVLLFSVFSQRVSSPIFLLALVSRFFGLCRQISLANVSSFKCIMLCVSECLHCLDHPNPIFLSGTVITILSHCQFFSGFPFLATESCYEVSE